MANHSKAGMAAQRMQTLMIAIGLLLMSAVGGWWWFQHQSPKKETAPLQTATVAQGHLETVVAATGRVDPNFEVEIKAKASGKIIRLPYDVSDVVKQGDLLVQLDPLDENRNVDQQTASLKALESRMSQSHVNLVVAQRNLQTDLSKARADLEAARAKYQDAQAKAKRLAVLVRDRYISQEEYETGMTNQAQAKTTLENAQIREQELKTQKLSLQAQMDDEAYAREQAQAQRVAVASSRQRLLETQIYAPISGVVTSRLGQIGQIVSSGISNVGGGTAILTLADLSHIYVLASVDESDIGQVKEGQTVHITADSFPGARFEGRVMRIAPKGVEDSNVVTFEVKIAVQSPNSVLLKPMMTTNVEIVTAERSHALYVPAEAVQSNAKGQPFVWVPPNAQGAPPRRQRVAVGLSNGSQTEILQGLAAGQSVVLGMGQTRSHWRKSSGAHSGTNAGASRQGQMMMMHSLGGGRR